MFGSNPSLSAAGADALLPADWGATRMHQSANWPSDNYTGLTISPLGMNYIQAAPNYVPVTPRSGNDRPTWNLVMQPESGSRCNTDQGAFKDPFYGSFWVIAQGSGAITSSYLNYETRLGQETFPGTNRKVVHPTTETTMGQTKTTTGFGYVMPPCPIGGSLANLDLLQAIVLNHPSG